MAHDWFEVKELPSNIYAIREPHYYFDVISYLVIGSESSLLIDTGTGLANILDVIKELYSGELQVVNTHFHFDHVGNNHRFPKVMIYNDPTALSRLRMGYSASELAPHNKESYYLSDNMTKYRPHSYSIEPSNPAPIDDGHVIDLGDRKIKLIHTPGHCPDCCVLWEEKTGTLFTGDFYFPGPLCCHYEGTFYGKSCLSDYAKSALKVAELTKNVKTIHAGHLESSVDPSILVPLANTLRDLLAGKIDNAEPLTGDLSVAALPCADEPIPDGYVIPKDLHTFTANGVEIISHLRHDGMIVNV